MKKRMRKTNTGITLIEMIIATSLMSVFSIFLVDLVMATQTAWSIGNTSAPVRTEGSRTLEVIAKELREGDPSAYGGVVIDGSENSQRITFSVPKRVSAASGILDWRQIQYAHDAVQRQVTRTADGNTTTVGRNVDSLQFSNSNNVITVTIGTSKVSAEEITIQATVSSQLRMRN